MPLYMWHMQARQYCKQTLSSQLCGVCRQVLLAFAEYLCQHQSTNEQAQRIVENMNLFLLPSANPDGFEAMTRENRCMHTARASHSAAAADIVVLRAQVLRAQVLLDMQVRHLQRLAPIWDTQVWKHCLRPLLTS